MKILFEIVGVGYANITVERKDGKKWGASLPPDTDLSIALQCMWEGDTEITPVLIPDEIKTAIVAKWAELGK